MFILFTSIKSLSFYIITFTASLTILTSLLPQSRDISCYVIRPILAPPPLWLQKNTGLRAHYFAQSPCLWHQYRLADVTRGWSWRHFGIIPPIINCCSFHFPEHSSFFITENLHSPRHPLNAAMLRDRIKGTLCFTLPTDMFVSFFCYL